MREKNTFKYVSFNDQIAAIHVDTKQMALPADAGDQETFFHKAIAESNEIDFGDQYSAFLKSIKPLNVRTYAQLLHKQKDVVTKLLEHLLVEDGSSNETLLNLSLALARDLREGFYEHLWDFFKVIITLLEKVSVYDKDAKTIGILETGFIVIATLFKIFWRKIVTELRRTFSRFLPLFGSNVSFIRRFSAESFAFFLRKSNDVGKQVEFMISKAAECGAPLVSSVAHLIFNALRGVSKQFVRNTKDLLTEVLEAVLRQDNVDHQMIGVEILSIVMKLSVVYTERQHSVCITSVLLESLQKSSLNGGIVANNIAALLIIWVTERRGEVFAQRTELFRCLATIADSTNAKIGLVVHQPFLTLISKAIATYQSDVYDLREVLPKVINAFVTRASNDLSTSDILCFFKSLIDHVAPHLENEILNSLIKYTENRIGIDELAVLSFYARLVSEKRPYSIDAVIAKNFPPLNFPLHPNLEAHVVAILLKNVRTPDWKNRDSMEALINSVVIWPWLCRSSSDIDLKVSKSVLRLFKSFQFETWIDRDQEIKLAALCAYSMNIVNDCLRYVSFPLIYKAAQQVWSFVAELWFLRLLLILVPYNDKLFKNQDCKKLVDRAFNGPFSETRIICLELYNRHYIMEEYPNFIGENVFSILLAGERTPLTLQDYRNKATHFRRLNSETLASFLPPDVTAEKIALQVTLAQYYENLTVYWPLITEIVSCYAEGMDKDTFTECLLSAAKLWRRRPVELWLKIDESIESSFWITCPKRPVNFLSCELQIYELMSRMPLVCQDYIEEEHNAVLYRVSEQYRISWDYTFRNVNLKVKVPDNIRHARTMHARRYGCPLDNDSAEQDQLEVQTDDDDGQPWSLVVRPEHENDEDNEKMKMWWVTVPAKTNRNLHEKKVLLALLSLYGQFTHSTVDDTTYLELLCLGDEDVQKAALKCLFTCHFKPFLAYKENLENLVDRQKFTDELLRFGIDEQNGIVAETDRPDLMKIVVRIVFGLLHSHMTTRSEARRDAIYRFLGGCRSHELNLFIRLTFRPFYAFMALHPTLNFDRVTIDTMCEGICKYFTISNCIRLKWIKSCLNCVSKILRHLVAALDDVQCHLIFRIMLACSIYVRLIAENKEHIKSCYFSQIQDLRQLVIRVLCQFFQTLQDSVLTECHLSALFSYVLEPLSFSRNSNPLNEFNDGIPEGLANVFLSFLSAPSLFPLLDRPLERSVWDGEEKEKCKVTPMNLLCLYLICKSTNDQSACEVLRGIKKLLTIDNDGSPGSLQQGISYAAKLVIGNTRTILLFLARKITSDLPGDQSLYLEILDLMSIYIDDPEYCQVFSKALLKGLKDGGISRHTPTIANLLNALGRFVSKVTNPIDCSIFGDILKLIPLATDKEIRRSVVTVTLLLSRNRNVSQYPEVVEQLASIDSLESWDVNKVDEIDFTRRNDQYIRLSENFTNEDYKCQPAMLNAYVNICCHLLRTFNDYSLKERAESLLKLMIEYTCARWHVAEFRDESMKRVLIPEVLKGLRHSDETVRRQFVKLLSVLVQECDDHAQLRSLRCLLDINKDESEKDFFAGVINYQSHRRQRTMFALTKALANGEINLPATTLTRFILPIIQPYLLNFTSGTSTLSDYALNLFGEILKKASWSTYFSTLNNYINQLLGEHEKDKPIIRVIVKVIDSFHFNVHDVELPSNFLLTCSSDTVNLDDSDCVVIKSEIDEKITIEQKFGIIKKVVLLILPKLRKCIDGKGNKSAVHKKAGSHFDEDDDISRAPIALATVKLLMKLPQEILQQNLHGVLLKLCSLLLSTSDKVRDLARKTMISVMVVLGSNFLPFVIRELRGLMKNGFQVHAMVLTVHVLISAMQESLKSGDLDGCLKDLIEVCNIDQFSDVADEKEVAGIRAHVSEAKADKSGETYHYMGRFIGTRYLNVVVEHLMKIIEEKPQSKTRSTVARLLEAYGAGLCRNDGIDLPTLLVFVYQMLCQYSSSTDENKKSLDSKPKTLRPESCQLLPNAPTRIGSIVRSCDKSRSFVLVEFALHLFNAILKKCNNSSDSEQLVSHLDPFVPHLVHCLHLKYDRVVSGALRSVVKLLEYPLPKLKSSMTKIVDLLFGLLNDYAGLGRAGDMISVLELTQHLFKAFTRIIKCSPNELFSKRHMQVLLTYVETDIVDPHKQATAFSLLKAIISKKISDDRLPRIIDHLLDQSIYSHSPNIRAQCRQVVVAFATTHPLGRNIGKFFEFALLQLTYEHEDGRLSALETLNLLFSTLSETVVDDFAVSSFAQLATGLVNEERTECKLYFGLALRSLVKSCSEKARNNIYISARGLLESTEDSKRFAAARSLNEICEAMLVVLASKVNELSAIVSRALGAESVPSEDTIVALFELMGKLTQQYPEQLVEAVKSNCSGFWEKYEEFAMCKESLRIQTICSEFLGHLFTAFGSESDELNEWPLTIKQLSGLMLWQMKSKQLTTKQAQLVIENLIYLAMNSRKDDEFSMFFAFKLHQICMYEVNHDADQALRRMNVFKLTAAVFLKGDEVLVEEVMKTMMLPLTRELNGKSDHHTDELRQMAADVCDVLKGRIGESRYANYLADSQQKIAKRAEERKRERKELAVTEPGALVEIKAKKHHNRAVALKRKMEQNNPNLIAKRRRTKDGDVSDCDD